MPNSKNVVAVLLLVLWAGCTQRVPRADAIAQLRLVEMGPDPGRLSGAAVPVYRLARYEVRRVCRGRLRATVVTVAHFNGSDKEVSALRVNEEIIAAVRFYEEPRLSYASAEATTAASAEMKAALSSGVNYVAEVAQPANAASCQK